MFLDNWWINKQEREDCRGKTTKEKTTVGKTIEGKMTEGKATKGKTTEGKRTEGHVGRTDAHCRTQCSFSGSTMTSTDPMADHRYTEGRVWICYSVRSISYRWKAFNWSNTQWVLMYKGLTSANSANGNNYGLLQESTSSCVLEKPSLECWPPLLSSRSCFVLLGEAWAVIWWCFY